MPKEVELILPEGAKTKRVGLYTREKYTVKIGEDYTEGLLTLAEVCQSHYIDGRTSPGPAQQLSFERYNRCLSTANMALSKEERYAFALECAYILKDIASNGGMKFEVEIIENFEPPAEVRAEIERRRAAKLGKESTKEQQEA